ncbi:hypothetical protein LZ30DRAFT_718291 [Colletotrichum cereale]|nr:hypothetical protein LZ30DRAFT_718291 [Colletotrichum cereale]
MGTALTVLCPPCFPQFVAALLEPTALWSLWGSINQLVTLAAILCHTAVCRLHQTMGQLSRHDFSRSLMISQRENPMTSFSRFWPYEY